MEYLFPLPDISGSAPGKIDRNQPTRLLHDSTSTLFFATYHPLAATNPNSPHTDHHSFPSDVQLPSHQRIVVEMNSRGSGIWKFVPRAHWDDGVSDEGTWPREVLFGETSVLFSQDQWDIHKLDPEYECTVHLPPMVPTVKVKNSRAVSDALRTLHRSNTEAIAESILSHEVDTRQEVPPLVPQFQTATDSSASSHNEAQDCHSTTNIPTERATRSHPAQVQVDTDDSDLDEDPMPVDGGILHPACVHASLSTAPFAPDAQITQQHNTFPPSDEETDEDLNYLPQLGKRKAPAFDGRHRNSITDSMPSYSHPDPKRTRRVDPQEIRVKMKGVTAKFEKKRKRRDAKRLSDRIARLQAQLIENLILEEKTQTRREAPQGPGAQPSDLGESREDEIQESIRKMREINELERTNPPRKPRHDNDEPVKPKTFHRAQPKHSNANKKAPQKKGPEFDRERAERHRQEFIRQQKIELWRRGYHTRATNLWTEEMAYSSYCTLSSRFDVARFGAEGEIPSFDSIPWPILTRPEQRTLESVNWESVEQFFEAVERLKPREYKTILKEAKLRFHPDKWKSRGVLTGVTSEMERDSLELAVNTVVQAITALGNSNATKN